MVTHEAAVTARRYIKKGEVVKYLCGIQVVMTEEEEAHIKSSRRDFSIVISSRSGAASLFLGPARFANHDCGANARLRTTGSAGMEIYAIQDIEVGDEITVSYGMIGLPLFASISSDQGNRGQLLWRGQLRMSLQKLRGSMPKWLDQR